MFIVLLREGDSMIQIKFMVEVILLLMYVVSGDGHGVLMTVLNVHCTSFTGWGLILSYNWMDCLKLTSKHYNNCSKCMILIVGVFPAITANRAVFCQPLSYGCVRLCPRYAVVVVKIWQSVLGAPLVTMGDPEQVSIHRRSWVVAEHLKPYHIAK